MHQKRIRILLWITMLLLFALLVRLGHIQLVDGGKYSGISDERRITRTPLAALRGKILDRNGFTLATNRHSFDISVKYDNMLYCYQRCDGQLLPRLARIKAHQEKAESCAACHTEQEHMFRSLQDMIGSDSLQAAVRKTVKRVELIKNSVSMRAGKEMRIAEEVGLHAVAHNVPFDIVAAIESRRGEFPGISIEIKPYRWYPNGQLASHIIGYTGKIRKARWDSYSFKGDYFDNWPRNFEYKGIRSDSALAAVVRNSIDDKCRSIDRMFSIGYRGHVWAGRAGVEANYNAALLGRHGERFAEITYANSRPDKVILERSANTGENIVLTIDRSIQIAAEDALGDKVGAIVVMNPWNGEIYAMASNPGFNPNSFGSDFNDIIKDKRKPLLHRPIQGTLPPGSTFKIVTAVAALAEKSISPGTMFECTGRAGSAQDRFRCSSRYGHSYLNVEDALCHSCNVFFFKAAKRLGGKLLHKWSKNLGFGDHTGVDLPYERRGLSPESGSISETMNMSIGQGRLLATPIQVARMTALIANGGKNVHPHILKRIVKYTGDVMVETGAGVDGDALIPHDVVEIIKRGMIRVVTEGTARKVGIGGYLVAGKTGTAETGRRDDNHAWFTGFAPYDRPQYCFTVAIEHTPMHGAEAAAPALKHLMANLFPAMGKDQGR